MPRSTSKKASKKRSSSSHPHRNISDLHTCQETYNCALNNDCIPCAYKIAAFDIALDSDFTHSVPNVRPEMCPRLSSSTDDAKQGTGHGYGYGYQEGMNIMTVGDGDFSFSLAMARILHKRKDKHDTPNLVATSYESHATLLRVYPDIEQTLHELTKLNVTICYQVDATNLKTLPPSIQKRTSSFHRIIWNFPCTAIQNGQDGQNQQMHDNQMLVKKFMKECQSFLSPTNGEIQFMHKTKPPYDQWGLERIAVEEVSGEDVWDSIASACPFEYKGRVVFDRCLLPPYVPRKALDKKSFPCHDACLFIFGWSDTIGRGNIAGIHNELDAESQRQQFTPTIPVHGNNDKDDGQNKAEVLPVTVKIIDEIRSSHMNLGSYKDRKKRKMFRR
jgi:hypothetical protein